MGVTKKRAYKEERLDNFETARGVAHPARMTILEYLREYPDGAASTFTRLTELSQATVSQHLRAMERAGIVETDYLESGGVARLTREADELILQFCLSILSEEHRKKLL